MAGIVAAFVERPERSRIRATIVSLHRFTGLMLAIYIVFISLTGSILIFRKQLSPWIAGRPATLSTAYSGTTAAGLSYDGIARAIHTAQPGWHLDEIDDAFTARGRTVLVYASRPSANGTPDTTVSSIDPRDGRIATTSPFRRTAIDSLHDLHAYLVSGDIGLHVNGVCAALMLVSILSGIVVWWRGIKRWAQGLSIAVRASRRRIVFDTHAALGFWSFTVLVVWSLSGFHLAFPKTAARALAIVVPTTTGSDAPTTYRPITRVVSLDAMAAVVRGRPLDGVVETDLILPRVAGDAVAITRELAPFSRSETNRFDPATGALLTRMPSGRTGDMLVSALDSIHFGDMAEGTPADVAVKAFWTLIALVPCAIAVTGVAMYVTRRERLERSKKT